MIRVVLLVPSAALRAGLRTLLSEDDEVEVVAEAAAFADLEKDGGDLIPADADIILADPDVIEVAALAQYLAQVESSIALLLLTDDSQTVQVFTGLPLRAWGLLPFDASEDELLAAVHALYQGLLVGEPTLIQPLLGHVMVGGPAPDAIVEELTERETEVLQLLAQGLANKQIALQLDISAHTVKFHVSSIYAKLGVTNRTEAVTFGARQGLITL
ncbi:MAG: response regulator transcription factor [Chloroflexi bacterium]|nr:response regulator transcription factor [Chloroflexota bacterium]